MSEHKQLISKTLADTYADQGHYSKAIEIYEQLSKKFPDNTEFARVSMELTEKMSVLQTKKELDLIPLFREWLDLMIKYRQVSKSD